MKSTLIKLKAKELLLKQELATIQQQISDELNVYTQSEKSSAEEFDTTLKKAINQLKWQMLSGEGEWLEGPVIQEGNLLKTSDKALNNASESLGLSHHLLRGGLSRAQHWPILRLPKSDNCIVLNLDD